jgi:hypothetical protein
MRVRIGILLVLSIGCSSSSETRSEPPAPPRDAQVADSLAVTDSLSFDEVSGPGEGPCDDPAKPPLLAADFGTLAPEFAADYAAYDLGPIPPPSETDDPAALDPLGGVMLDPDDPNSLIFVGNSERPNSALYRVALVRDACGHVRGFSGRSSKLVDVPYADANVVRFADGTTLASVWPLGQIAEISPSLSKLVLLTDLRPLGVAAPARSVTDNPGESPGGLGIVPATLTTTEPLRLLAYPSGNWFRVTARKTGPTLSIERLEKVVALEHGPGAFAYVPAGSRGFSRPSVIMTEWFRGRYTLEATTDPRPENQRVAVYEVDANADPIPSTRRELFSRFDRPWGAYFEPVRGDFLFLSWLRKPDHVIAVRGFAKPERPR